jgi:hypothetical protein
VIVWCSYIKPSVRWTDDVTVVHTVQEPTVCSTRRWIIRINFHSFINQVLHSLAEASSPFVLSLIHSLVIIYFTSCQLEQGLLNSFLNLPNDCRQFGRPYLLSLFFYSPPCCLQPHTLFLFFPSVPLPISWRKLEGRKVKGSFLGVRLDTHTYKQMFPHCSAIVNQVGCD